jgi:hypothetical protein
VDRDETDEAPFNRENAPEVRTKSQRKPNSRHSKNWRLRELMMMLMLLMLQVDVAMVWDNLGQGQVEQCLKSLRCRLIDAEQDLDHREITGAAILNKEYKAGVKEHQGRKPSVYEGGNWQEQPRWQARRGERGEGESQHECS